MDIWDENKLVLFIVFVVPGFIAMKVYRLLSPSSQIDTSNQIIDAISYSCLFFGICTVPIYYMESSDFWIKHPVFYLLSYFILLFCIPILLTCIWKRVRTADWVQKFVPHPTEKPWDFVFFQRKNYWVIVTLKNGKKIGGWYGSNSFASSAPSEEQIFLEEEWILNDNDRFERKADQTSGIIILSSDIQTVEFFNDGGQNNE